MQNKKSESMQILELFFLEHLHNITIIISSRLLVVQPGIVLYIVTVEKEEDCFNF